MSVFNITVVTPRTAAIDKQVSQLPREMSRDEIRRLVLLLEGIQGNTNSSSALQVAIGSGTTTTKASGTVGCVFASATAGDIVQVGNVAFVGTAGAVTPGAATYSIDTSNTAIGASLASQINAHASLAGLVTATAASGTVTITAVLNSPLSNTIGLSKNVTTAAAIILNGLASSVTTSSLSGGAAGVDATPVTYSF